MMEVKENYLGKQTTEDSKKRGINQIQGMSVVKMYSVSLFWDQSCIHCAICYIQKFQIPRKKYTEVICQLYL